MNIDIGHPLDLPNGCKAPSECPQYTASEVMVERHDALDNAQEPGGLSALSDIISIHLLESCIFWFIKGLTLNKRIMGYGPLLKGLPGLRVINFI